MCVAGGLGAAGLLESNTREVAMDLRFTADETAFRDELRRFFRTEIPAGALSQRTAAGSGRAA